MKVLLLAFLSVIPQLTFAQPTLKQLEPHYYLTGKSKAPKPEERIEQFLKKHRYSMSDVEFMVDMKTKAKAGKVTDEDRFLLLKVLSRNDKEVYGFYSKFYVDEARRIDTEAELYKKAVEPDESFSGCSFSADQQEIHCPTGVYKKHHGSLESAVRENTKADQRQAPKKKSPSSSSGAKAL